MIHPTDWASPFSIAPLAKCCHQNGFSPTSESSRLKTPIVIAIDGTSASGKSTTAKLVTKSLGYIYVDTGAMYRTLAWHCLQRRIDVHDDKAVANACRRWKTSLVCVENQVRMLVDGYYPEKEI